MNLREEKSRLRKMRILLALNLSEKNEKLAKEYLDTTQPENEKLLEEVEHESFTFESNRKILECSLELEVIVKSNDTEYMKRYARFVTAVGGSTAFYVLHKEGRYILINRNYFSEYLTLEQVSAIEAEQLNYKIYGRYSFVTEKINEKNPVILKNAMHFCYEDSVGKLFLAAISLFYTKPIQAENKNDVICEVEQQEKESSLIVETLT
ncbi:MAG: hypothetical protein IKJ01_03010 [Lachnospiraceae bacterium]|nr:hypothetical protein [Lachnospiraceae bacterium]